jgi:hypothetical protein
MMVLSSAVDGFRVIDPLSNAYRSGNQSFCPAVLPILNQKMPVSRTNSKYLPWRIEKGNASPHAARASVRKLESLVFEQISHSPYYPDLAPLISFCSIMAKTGWLIIGTSQKLGSQFLSSVPSVQGMD